MRIASTMAKDVSTVMEKNQLRPAAPTVVAFLGNQSHPVKAT
jgi:hypothetical protein